MNKKENMNNYVKHPMKENNQRYSERELIKRELPAREGGDESSFLRLPFFDMIEG